MTDLWTSLEPAMLLAAVYHPLLLGVASLLALAGACFGWRQARNDDAARLLLDGWLACWPCFLALPALLGAVHAPALVWLAGGNWAAVDLSGAGSMLAPLFDGAALLLGASVLGSVLLLGRGLRAWRGQPVRWVSPVSVEITNVVTRVAARSSARNVMGRYGLLVVEGGDLDGTAWAIEGTTTIGRQGTTILLGGTIVSRRHAEIKPTNDGVVVSDISSTNGTAVQRGSAPPQPLERDVLWPLQHGDLLILGPASSEEAVVLRWEAPKGADVCAA